MRSIIKLKGTVDSEFFARVLFSQSFVETKSSLNGEITLSITDIEVNHVLATIFNVTSISFNAIPENKILAKISGFTVVIYGWQIV